MWSRAASGRSIHKSRPHQWPPSSPPSPQDGRQFTATVDQQNPSRLLLQDTGSRAVYALQTKVDRVNINNSLAMRLLFGDERWVGQLRQLR